MTDIVHHSVNAGLVVLIGVFCQWGDAGVEALSNIVMSGMPGGINYLFMYLWREGFMAIIRPGITKMLETFDLVFFSSLLISSILCLKGTNELKL